MPFVSKQTLTAFAAAVLFVSAFSPLASAARRRRTRPTPSAIRCRPASSRGSARCGCATPAPPWPGRRTAGRWPPPAGTVRSASGTRPAARNSDAAPCLLKSNLLAIAYLPDGKTIATRANENTLRLWDAATGREVRTLFPAQLNAVALAPGPEEGTLLELGADASVHVWDLTTGKETRTLLTQPRQATNAAGPFGRRPARRRVVAAGRRTHRLGHGGRQGTFPHGHTNEGTGEPSDGPGLLAGRQDPGRVRPAGPGRDVGRGNGQGTPPLCGRRFPPMADVHAGRQVDCRPRRRGRRSTSGTWLRARKCGSSRRRLPSARHGGGAGGLAFSPDGKTLAASQGTAIHLWDVRNGQTAPSVRRPHGRRGGRPLFPRRPARPHLRLETARPGCGNCRWPRKSLRGPTRTAPHTRWSGCPDGKSVLATSPGGWLASS